MWERSLGFFRYHPMKTIPTSKMQVRVLSNLVSELVLGSSLRDISLIK